MYRIVLSIVTPREMKVEGGTNDVAVVAKAANTAKQELERFAIE
jgi:hypothetical protein